MTLPFFKTTYRSIMSVLFHLTAWNFRRLLKVKLISILSIDKQEVSTNSDLKRFYVCRVRWSFVAEQSWPWHYSDYFVRAQSSTQCDHRPSRAKTFLVLASRKLFGHTWNRHSCIDWIWILQGTWSLLWSLYLYTHNLMKID